MSNFNFLALRNKSFEVSGAGLQLDGQSLGPGQHLEAGPLGLVSAEQLMGAARRYYDLTGGTVRVQVAALVFDVTADFRALDFYFPITNSLQDNDAAHQDFYNGVRYIANHPNFDLRVYGHNQQDVTDQTPPTVRHLVAGHLIEVFFHRRDILESFLSNPRHFQIYTDHQAFEGDNGLAGGDYRFDREAIQLEMTRLFEGYFGDTPGVAPILHELGHMLDHFDGGTGRMGQVEGMLPGMSPADGPLFVPQSRQLFVQGKRMERDRYQRYQDGRGGPNDPIPVGHPYVFQTDGEFIAGYFEMFFRNPNYFGSLNPVLYDSFATALQQDPRRYWSQDFPGYIGENRKAYLGGQRPSPQNINIPQDI